MKYVMQDILAPDQAYEGLYGQGNGTANGRAYQQGKYFVLNCVVPRLSQYR